MQHLGTSTSLDYRSKEVVEARLKEMIQRVDEKTKTDLKQDELLRACHALIAGVTTNPRFRAMKLANLEKVVFEGGTNIERPTSELLEVLLSKWLPLAEYAYTFHEKGERLEAELQNLLGHQYRLMRHSTNIETAGGVGYFLAVDPTVRKLLVGIKGTSTMSEMITDCLATTVPHQCIPHSPFDPDPTKEPEEIGVHEGILASSIKLLEELRPILEEKLPQGYSVELVGHSLGAGAASVLAVLLRAQFAILHQPGRLHAYCFATPPVLDHRAASLSRDFITAVVNRNDCVARMAIANVEVLVRMLEGFNEKIMKREGLNNFWIIAKEIAFNNPVDKLTDEQFTELVEIMYEAQDAVEIEHKEHLYVPGKILAMYGTMESVPEITINKKRGGSEQQPEVTVKPAIIGPSHTFLRYFEVNDRMLYDHTIVSYRESLSGCIGMMKRIEKEAQSEYGTLFSMLMCCTSDVPDDDACALLPKCCGIWAH